MKMGKTILTATITVLVATLVLAASVAATVGLTRIASALILKKCNPNSPEGQDTSPGDNLHGCGPDHLTKLK